MGIFSGAVPLSDLGRQFGVVAANWDAEHGPASARASEFAARIRYLRVLCGDLGRPRVLDLGCGTGQVLVHLAEFISGGTGVDISPAMIARAQCSAGSRSLAFFVGDAAEFCRNCPQRFELVLLIGALEHFPDQAAALAAVQRVLAPHGRLAVISPHPWSPLFGLKRVFGACRDMPAAEHVSPSRLRRLARRQGFELTTMRALPYAPWPVLSALINRVMGATDRQRATGALTGLLRGAFAAVFRGADVGAACAPAG